MQNTLSDTVHKEILRLIAHAFTILRFTREREKEITRQRSDRQ